MRSVLFPAVFVGLCVYKGSAFYTPAFTLIGIAALCYVGWNILAWLRLRRATYYYTSSKETSVPAGAKPRKLNVCVIGAGPSGIVAVKELLAEGHTVTCYEKHREIGGVFLYDKDKGGAYDSTVLTISNYLMSFSDSPPRKEAYRFWHHTEYFTYLLDYIKHFQLRENARFQFNTRVLKMEMSGATWAVTTQEEDGGKTETKEFDAVAVCSGAHQIPNIPTIRGQDHSPITICHSTSYKDAGKDPRIAGKRVICVGIGETGADVSAEIADAASKAWLSMRRTPHVVSRNHWNLNVPADAFSSRAMFYCNKAYIESLHNVDQFAKRVTSGKIGQAIFGGHLSLGDAVSGKLAELGARSGGGVARQFLTKNDKFIPKLLDGTLIEKPAISHLDGRTVYFTDGSKEENVDTIMLCTGFVDSFPFLPKELKISTMRDLYKHAFHPAVGPSVAFIGFARPTTGGVPACSEMVSRYWSLILSNKRKLPDGWKDRIAWEKQVEEKQFSLSGRISTLVFWGEYMEALGQHIGCSPQLFRYLFTRPFFWVSLLFGPLLPHHYRLRGPHAETPMAEDVVSNVIVLTPTPFAAAQSAACVLSFIGGSILGYRPPAW